MQQHNPGLLVKVVALYVSNTGKKCVLLLLLLLTHMSACYAHSKPLNLGENKGTNVNEVMRPTKISVANVVSDVLLVTTHELIVN